MFYENNRGGRQWVAEAAGCRPAGDRQCRGPSLDPPRTHAGPRAQQARSHGLKSHFSLAMFLVAWPLAGYLAALAGANAIQLIRQASRLSPTWAYIYPASPWALASRLLDAPRWSRLDANRPTPAPSRGGWPPKAATRADVCASEQRGGDASRLAERPLDGRRRHAARRGRPRADPPLGRRNRSQARDTDARDRGFRHGLQRQVVVAQCPGRSRRISHRRQGRHHGRAQRDPLARRRPRDAGRYARAGRDRRRRRARSWPSARPATPTWCCSWSTGRSRNSSSSCSRPWPRWRSRWSCA